MKNSNPPSSKKAYYEFHEQAYQQIKTRGGIGWGQAKTMAELSDPATLQYLQKIVSENFPDPSGRFALDLGCGSGSTAFVLARAGFIVSGIDISSTAIEMAQELSRQQNLQIDFKVGDVLKLEDLNQKFDLIYDSHCLHCIVFEEDRQRVLEGLRNSLKTNGIFVLDTMVAEGRDFSHWQGDLRFDADFILWHKTQASGARGEMELDGKTWCAQRRVYPADLVLKELKACGFRIMSQVSEKQENGHPNMLRMIAKI
jgi:2-polyprenyl-3-methyl-5-hydroxy-6-metoxy-1,4-benzoquinol methylase